MSQTASAAPDGSDGAVTFSSVAAVRAAAVSDPEPPPPPPPPPTGEAHVLFAPVGEFPGDQFGNTVAGAGDVNGDGYPDVIIGAWTSDWVTGDAGSAYVYYGGPGADAVPDWILRGEGFYDNFATSVASAGDMNGDGYGDVIVGAYRSRYTTTRTGRAYVYFGGPSADPFADLVLLGEAFDDRFGVYVASARDLNGDGFSDVIVGAATNDAAGPDAGRAYVYFGGSVPNSAADLTLTGQAAGDHFGWELSSAGDWNADGFDDLVVGAYGAGGTGRAYLFLGGPGLDAIPDLVYTGQAPGDHFGASIGPAGDVNGDGYDDLLVAANMNDAAGTDAGRVYLFHGGPGADAIADLVFTGASAGDGFGQSVASAGDLNGDGVGDVIVGAWLNDANGINAGRAYVYFGGPSMDAGADIIVTGEAPEDRFGIRVAGLGDVNQDGAADFGVGAYFNDTAGDDVGRAYVMTMDRPVANRPPVLTVPASVFGAEGVSISLTITATDPDGDHVTLAALNRPVQSLFVDFGNNSGEFSWTPGFGEAGNYTVTFTGRDDLGATASRDLAIVIDNVNRGPTALPGGPYVGVVNVPITFNGTGSSDPDGGALSYLWDFGDGASGTGVTPQHAYAVGGTFPVTLTVSDGALAGNASTIATVQDIFPARAFTSASNRTIRLGSGKATWCAEIEPVGDAFLTTSVLASTITMNYGTGQITALVGSVEIGGDKDANGILEMTACFTKADLRTLFDTLPKGTSTVTVTLEGGLNTGGAFRATLTVDVVKAGGALSASLSPNPLNPGAILTFMTSRPGRVRVTVFDSLGRLVRTLEPGARLEAGYHDIPVDGRNDRGEPLSSGAYFYRIEAAEGVATGRFVILK